MATPDSSDNAFLEKMQAAPRRAADPKPAPQPGRRGKRLVSCWQEPDTARRLKVLAAEEDTTVQALMTEALNLLFQDRGLPPVF